MVQDTTSCQLLSASYLALGEDPQRQNVSAFCTNTKRHRRVNGKVAVSLKTSNISNPNTTSSYWSLSWKARQIYLALHLTNKSQQRSQNDKTYPPQAFAKYLAQVPSGLNGSPAALYLWFTMHRAVSIGGSLPVLCRASDGMTHCILHSLIVKINFSGENHSHGVRI